MSGDNPQPTVDELYELLKRTSLPTVLVEGKDDIIFYRKIEEDLIEFDVDMLPAGNKGAVLELYERISADKNSFSSPLIYVVDNDLWVHGHIGDSSKPDEVITTKGYSIENDLYSDGELENLCSSTELAKFRIELDRFLYWYALAVDRKLRNVDSTFRTHPRKVLEETAFYKSETNLKSGENYPDEFLTELKSNYFSILRGKSLFALLVRQLSSKQRPIKFSVKQLMEIGASRRGENYQRLCSHIRSALLNQLSKGSDG